MSDVPKPVEEQPAPVVEATAPETKVEESTTVAEEPSTAPEPPVEAADAVEPAAVEPAAVTEEATAPAAAKEFAGEGVLGYKAPGGFMKKVLGFREKYFWLGSDPVESKQLNSYLRGEKPEHANNNAAWASQTGKGLLFFSKNESEKANPAGIINLADVSGITDDGTVEFSFQMYGAKHVFQCVSVPECKNWVALFNAKATEAAESAERIKSSDGYKEQHAKLSKPVTPIVAPVVAASSKTETKKEEKAEEKKEEKARKSRSASRKRNSIFGNFGLGSKKEEAKEEKANETKEATAPAPEAPADGPSEAPVSSPVEEAPKVEEAAPASPVEAKKPAASKRNSVFGTITSKFATKKAASDPKTDTPAVPPKDEANVEPISDEAPVIPPHEASESLAAAVQSPATAPTEEAPVTNGTSAVEPKAEEAKSETKPAIKSERRKSSLPFGLGSMKEKTEKAPEVDGEKPKSPFAKFRQTIKGKSSPKAKTAEKSAEKSEETPAADAPATTSESAEATTEPVVSEPVSAIKPSQEVSAAA